MYEDEDDWDEWDDWWFCDWDCWCWNDEYWYY